MVKDTNIPNVGVIPVDWEVKNICDVAEVVSGGTPSTFTQKYWNGNINWFTPTEIGFNKYSYESLRKITEEGLKDSSAKLLPIGTILLTSRASIGDVSILKVPASTNQGFQSLIANENIDNEFLYYIISTLKNTLIKYASGSTFLEISPNKLKSIAIKLPPSRAEQRVIASALSDVDALITAQEQLITKKRNIKQGAMQQLLTGKKRLPGFSGEWDISTLKNLSDYITVGFVGSMSHLFTTEGVPLLRGTNIQPGYLNLSELKYISEQTHSLWKKSSLESGDIAVVRVGYPGTATVIPENMGALNSASLVIIRPKKDKVNSNYICYVLNSNWGKREIQNQLVGGAQQVFNIKTASEFKISIPPTKSEQDAIATILNDMDTEIKALEQEREKYIALKQGMKQELLTGKTRLV
jgi:restriction endonuclease S subunit